MAKVDQIHQRNLSIIALLEKKSATGEPYTQDDLTELQHYTGSGGLLKAGAKGRGALYEYYTPDEVVARMWALAFQHGFTSGRILEPSAGIGRFIKYVDPDSNHVRAFETSPISAQILRACFPWVELTEDYFETLFYNGTKRVGHPAEFDLVIGNPPYGPFNGAWAGKKLEGRHTRTTRYDQYFMEKGLEVLKPGGLLVMIVPSAFLDNEGSYADVKEYMRTMAELVDAYRMPRKLFEMTGIGTDIIVLKRI